jgi:hypothetical protein
MKLTKLILTAGLLAAINARAADPVGKIAALSGNVTVARASRTEPLNLNDPVYQGDKISTAMGAKVQIHFLDDSVFMQGEKSEVVIDEMVYDPANAARNAFTVSVAQGAYRVISGRIVEINPERFKVKTKYSVIEVRGCDVTITSSEDGDVVIIDAVGAGREVLVTALFTRDGALRELIFTKPGGAKVDPQDAGVTELTKEIIQEVRSQLDSQRAGLTIPDATQKQLEAIIDELESTTEEDDVTPS